MNTVSTSTKNTATCAISCGITCTAVPMPADIMIGMAVGNG